MTEGKNKIEIAEFDALIADPAEKEAMLDKQNQLAQEELMRRMGMVMPPPPTPRSSNGNGKPK